MGTYYVAFPIKMESDQNIDISPEILVIEAALTYMF